MMKFSGNLKSPIIEPCEKKRQRGKRERWKDRNRWEETKRMKKV